MFQDYSGFNLRLHELAGTPQQMGKAQADHLKNDILHALTGISDYFQTTEDDLDNTPSYTRWRAEQIDYHARRFPHFIAETEALAQHSGISRNRLFDLTFNGFGVVKRHKSPPPQCSLIAVTTRQGHPALLSVLDDAQDTWPAIGHYKPADPNRHAFLATIWLGTAGAGRGMNDAGLWLGTASCGVSAAPGGPMEKHRPYALGYLLRDLLETCTTVEQAHDFCRQYPFCMNMLIGDAHGHIRALHQTLNGPYDVTGPGFASMTNAITDDSIIYNMTCAGLLCKESVPTARPRNGFLRDFIHRKNQKCSFEEFTVEVARRDTVNPWSINHHNTVYLTLALPAQHPRTLWVCRPADPVNGADFIRLEM